MVAIWEGCCGGRVKKGKGLSTNCQLQSSHRDVKYSTEYSQQYCSNYVWCQVAARLNWGITL